MTVVVHGQEKIFDNKALMSRVSLLLDHVYNHEFEPATNVLNEIEGNIPGHPAVYILKGIKIYWQFYPLHDKKEQTSQFVKNMESGIVISEKMLDENPDDIEAIIYDMVARGLLMMLYADNEESSKVFPHAYAAYRAVKKSFEYQEAFIDFYFFTGLYNYYIKAYPEKHPIYKPFTVLFRDGDKETGKKELIHEANNGIFLKAEANRFLIYIYLNFENNPEEALFYASKLYRQYPYNPYFEGKKTELLLITGKFEKARGHIISLLKKKNDSFSNMKGIIFKGIWEEKYKNNRAEAKENYRTGAEMAKKYGAIAENYLAYAYLGLSRVYNLEGDIKNTEKYKKLAEKIAVYEYYKRLN
jgi:hypothetical protein